MMVFCAFTAAALQHASDFCSPWKLNGIPVVRRNGSFAACREWEIILWMLLLKMFWFPVLNSKFLSDSICDLDSILKKWIPRERVLGLYHTGSCGSNHFFWELIEKKEVYLWVYLWSQAVAQFSGMLWWFPVWLQDVILWCQKLGIKCGAILFLGCTAFPYAVASYDSVEGTLQLLSNERAKINHSRASRAAHKQLSAWSAECGLHFQSANL